MDKFDEELNKIGIRLLIFRENSLTAIMNFLLSVIK